MFRDFFINDKRKDKLLVELQSLVKCGLPEPVGPSNRTLLFWRVMCLESVSEDIIGGSASSCCWELNPRELEEWPRMAASKDSV